MVQSIESALNEVESILQRMREISVQAANDVNNIEIGAISTQVPSFVFGTEECLLPLIQRQQDLDGTLSKNLQVGANGSDTIALVLTQSQQISLVTSLST